ncbi:lipoprotein 17-related variable surface protein [Mycoplasmopsis gallinacea]|uniref:ECM-binding protein homolog n=1 Tax=Mycoplasmopsis gallinacea TaxID=29556 RepID=A0A6H0V4D8_9BACT|nr:lipoprotein 17-related variable surface protein [Mycoplasmopsis gallinacea]QIW62594.1 hypothetical protein GOQ20_04250 [Mycoplasmopsis gallinacea]
MNFNDENSNWQYRAVGDSWFRLFDASNPGFPNNVNVSDWTGSNYATESGTLYSWQVDGFSNKNVDYGPWWNGNGYNAGTDTKRFKIGYNLINKPLHGSATQGAQSTFYTGAFYFSNDMKLASDIKIHLYIKVDDRNNSTVLQQKTYTIKLKEERNATLSDYDISPWIGKVQRVNKDSLQASKNGDSLEAWLTNYAYLPYYQNTPTSYTSGLSSDLLSKKRTWDDYKASNKHVRMHDILVTTPTNMSDIRDRGFQLSLKNKAEVNFGLFQKNLISGARPEDIIHNNQGGLFVFNIEMNRKLDYLVAGAVAEVEFEPYNDVANPSNTTFFGNTGSSTARKSFFGSAEYREKNDDSDQRIVSGFWKIADRSESQLKKFYTLETIDSSLGSDIYNPNSDAFPGTTLRITENENSNINYLIDKNRINRNKKTISTKSIYQDTKAVNNTNSLRLTSTISSTDVKKWKVKSGSSLTSTPLSSSRFDSNGIEFSPIVYTYTDLELAKRYVDTKQWLNKGQKDYLKILLDNESGFTASNQYSDSVLLTEWKAKIDTLDNQQQAIEAKYKEIRDFPLSNDVYDSSYNANITNKIIYALASQSSKDALDTAIERNINKINFRSSQYNTQSGAIDRTTSTEYSISSPSGASYNNLKSSIDAVYNALNNSFNAVINSGKTEIEKYFAKLAEYPITEQNSSTYSGNYNKAKNLIINTIKAQVKNLNSKSQLNPFVNLNATNEQINTIIDLISKVNKLNNDKNSVKSQIETYKQSQNDFNNLGSFEFASSTNQIDLTALDAFDKNLTNASDKTIQNIFASTDILTSFYNTNNDIFTQQWIEKAKALNGAINEFNTEIDKFNYLDASQKSSAKNALQSALSSNKIFTYNENTVTLSLNNEFIKKINDQMASAFATAKTTAKNKISALNELTEAEKTQVKQEIDSATIYKDSYDANQPFTDKILIGSDKNIKAIVDKWTDINNERARIKDYTATFDYPDKNIDPTAAQQNLVSQQSISPDANGLETKIISISGNNDTGTLTVTYRVVKSSDKTNVYTQNKTYDITGFANEQNRVNNLNATPDYKDASQKPNIQASAVVKRDNNTEDITWVLPERTQIYPGSVRYLGYNDITGKIKIAYKLQSTVDESVISNEKTAEITGFQTEEQRLNNLIDNKQKEFNFSGTKAKDKTTVDEATKENLSGYLVEQLNDQLTNINNQNNAIVVIDEITNKNPDGTITFNYHLKSTRSDIQNNTVVSKTLSATMSGFQSNLDREKADLDAKTNDDLNVVIDKNKMASSFNPDQIQLNPKDDTISVVDKTIAGYNDVIGAIKLTYKLKSNKNGQDVYSEPKEIIITGLKTEAQRLNEILNNLVEGDITFNGTKNNQLPSISPANDKANYSYDATKQNTNKASAFINSIKPDDSTGQNTLNLKLVTTKTQNELISNWNVTNYEAPESQNKDLVITGFRTQAEQNKIDQDAEKARLTKLVANAQITYPDSDQILASSSQISGINAVINSTDNNAEIIIQNITDKNDINGTITVAYVIHSTKGGIYEDVNTDVQNVVLNNFKTEQQRLDELFKNKVATASLTGIDSTNYRQYLPEEALDHLILAVADLENAKVEIVSKTSNNQTNSIDYTYRLVSTRGVVSGHDLNTVTSTETKSGSLPGFKTVAEAEKERLDNLNPNATDDGYTHTIDYSDRNQILASKVKISDQNWTWSVEPNTDHTFSDQEIIAYDDITGKLRVKYKLKSTKPGLSDVKSEYKYATLTGYKTELERLNDLAKQANQPVTITAKDEAKKGGTDQKKASQLTSDDFNATLTEYGQNENVKIETILDTQNANNETGTIQLGYKLISTRPLTGTDGLISGTWDDAPEQAPTIKSDTSNPLLSFDGYVTNDDEEENRIERLIADLVIDYPGKEQWLPLYNETNVIPSGVQVKLSDNRELSAEDISIKENSMTIVSRDDRKGEITVSYTLVSNSRQAVEVEINQTRSKNANTIKGFKTELQRLDELTYSWENAIQNKSTISPSDVILSNITPVSTNDDQAKDVVITSFDDRTGTLNVQYNIYSKRTDLTDIHVVNKTAQITGLQTELQRLNALIVNDQVSKTINYVPNDKAQIKASSLVNKKAEVLANNDNSYFTTLIQDPNTSKAKIIIRDITADDETGQLTVKYVLQSTKDNLTDINSDTENRVVISGFLTNLQEAKNNLKAKIDELVQNNKLTSEQAQALKEKIDSNETDSIDKVNKIELEVDKQVLVNEVEKDFVHLNKAQLADVINKINEAATLEDAKIQKAAGQTLDDKMAKLDEIVKNYEAKKPLDKYTYASETPKNAFDKVIEDAKKLLDKTNTTDLGTDNLDNWIGDEETNTKGEIQSKYEALDGDIQKTIQEVTNNEYLSPKQKEDLINKLNSLDPNTLEKANDDGTKLTLNDIKDEIAQIEAVKKAAINLIKAYENLNQQQKDAYINQIKSSDNDQLETIENNATTLDNKMLELKQAIENVKDVPNSSAYQNADQNNKDAFDNALNVANKIKNGKENTDSNDTFNYNANLDAVQKAIDDLKLANTNINRDEALKYVDNAPYLSTDEKAKFKEQLNQNPITDETIAKLKEQAQIINDAKKVYVDQIKAIDNNDLDQNNKDKYINQIINKEMTLDENNVITNPEDFSKIVFDAQKEALLNKLENNVNQPDLPNILNPKQLTEAKEAINNATDLAEAQKAYEDAINLSKKMAALDKLIKNYEKSIADPNNTKYNKADNKEQFDDKLDEAKKLLTSDSDNGVDNELLEDLLSNNDKSLQHLYEELNGLENDLIEQINNSEVLSPNEKANLIAQVNNIDKHNDEAGQVATLQDKLNKLIADKNNHIKAIENLENLNQSQKDDLINRIKNNDLVDNPAILDQAQNLDNKMKELKDEIAKENEIKGSSYYNKVSEEKRNNYENALINAKKLVNNETPNGYNSANTSLAETQEILDKLKQSFKVIDDETKKINDLYEKLNAKIIEYQKDVDNKELPKEIQDILDELVNYDEDINGINKLIELIKQGKFLKSLNEQWNNSDVKNPDTEKSIQDLNAKINSITELINSVKSSNLNSKLDTSKNFVLNQNQYNLNFAEAEISYFDALENVDKTKFIEATNKLEQLNQTKFVEFANSILNTSYFDTYKPESNLNKKLTKELLKLNYDPLNKIEKSLFETLLKEKAGVEEKLSWLWYLALGLSTTLAAIMIGVLVKKSKK